MPGDLMCQARGCAASVAKASGVWCPRHRRDLRAADIGLLEETEIAARRSREWTLSVRKAQDVLVSRDQEAAKQTEMF